MSHSHGGVGLCWIVHLAYDLCSCEPLLNNFGGIDYYFPCVSWCVPLLMLISYGAEMRAFDNFFQIRIATSHVGYCRRFILGVGVGHSTVLNTHPRKHKSAHMDHGKR